MREPVLIPVDDPSRAGEVRRAAVVLGAAAGLPDDDRGRLALLATEAATNLAKHARGGEVVLRWLTPAEGDGVEVLALDRGPGMADVGQCLTDGYSTTGTAGKGLGAVRRLADRFDIYSAPPAGTVLLARVLRRDSPSVPPPADAGAVVGGVCLPVAGETACGDAWAVERLPGRTAVLVADGIGHGPQAATAGREAVRVFRGAAGREPDEVMALLHAALRPTRGAAAAVAVIDRGGGQIRFAGVGNVAATVVYPGGRRGLVSLPGTLGHNVHRVQPFAYPWPPGATLVLCSDGIATHWELARSPGLLARHPGVIAGAVFRDFRRGRDDATVVAVRDV